MPDIEIEINGQKCKTKPGKTIIEVADEVGITIPRFCYHKKLKVAANCRMCLVEVEKAPKTLPACATPVADGMKVFTQSKKTLESQRAVMEFLLINHPLDCPICDQGGECELQDLSMGYGEGVSRYTEGKRSVKDEDLGPLIATDMTRCIQCTRCVRFGEEVAGLRELGATGRGEHMRIGTYVKHTVKHEMSGNIIDLCPVGALTSKPYRFQARAWELTQRKSIAPHDCAGSNVFVHTRRDKVMRVVPKENEQINETWISDRDRFSYVGVNSPERLTTPMMKINGEWQPVAWEDALKHVTAALKDSVSQYGADQCGVLLSPSSTSEEGYLLQKILSNLGSYNVDHRLREIDFADQEADALYPSLSISLMDIESYKDIVLVGANICREQPIVAHRVRKAVLEGASVASISMLKHAFHFDVAHNIAVTPSQFVLALTKLTKACLELSEEVVLPEAIQTTIDQVDVDDVSKAMAKQLMASEKSLLLMGALTTQHPQASQCRYLLSVIAHLTKTTFGMLTEGANTGGLYLAGAIPHRRTAGQPVSQSGLTAYGMLSKTLRAMVLLNVEPDRDVANPALAMASLKEADHVIALTAFDSPSLRDAATVMLPITPFTENEGSYLNVEGTWQSFQPVVHPLGESKPAWKVLRVLGELLEFDGFEFNAVTDIYDELRSRIDDMTFEVSNTYVPETLSLAKPAPLERISEVPLYAVDMLVRHSEPLQQMMSLEGVNDVHMNTVTATALEVKAGDIVTLNQAGQQQRFAVNINECIPDRGVAIAAATEKAATLGCMFATVEVTK